MGEERFPSKCTFCNSQTSFVIKDGKKVVDKPCTCRASESYFSEKAVAERLEAEKLEAKRVGIES